VLSRIAESLYWMGRFIERADDTARLLDVHSHVLLEDRWADEAAACQVLLDVMGVPEDLVEEGDLTAQAVTNLLAHDSQFPGSIRASLTAAWENARGARETISSEMWETINAANRVLPEKAGEAGGPAPHEYFGWVKETTTAFAGLADSTMSRDDGWRFMMLGRSLERADMTTRLVSARYGETWGPTGWTTTLRCCAGYEAYLRTYRRGVDASLALEFLLLDRLFPRSVFHALTEAEEALAELDPRASRSGVDDEARRYLGRVCAELEFLRVDELMVDLPAQLTRIQEECGDVHDAVARRYFRETRALEWETRSA
jgi:uncharacterized alpha-E superfamily protein